MLRSLPAVAGEQPRSGETSLFYCRYRLWLKRPITDFYSSRRVTIVLLDRPQTWAYSPTPGRQLAPWRLVSRVVSS